MNYTGDPTKIQVGQKIDITNIYNEKYKIENINYAGRTPDGKRRTSLPKTGIPNSKDTLYNPDGTPKQDRYYGPDGLPELDVDHNHNGNNIPFPHSHDWPNGRRNEDHNPVPDSLPDYPEFGNKVAEGITLGVILYWIISESSRLIPVRNLIPIP
ncbi:MAG: hypothetical protein UH854_02680 [Clostridia bacterium]|nr:hypothetical protein [Clostridia bacterium]